mgnify:CR=1 FL=1
MKYAQINRLVHRDMRPKVVQDASVVDVVYGDGNTLRLPNRQWSYNNPYLQFLAVYGLKPSEATVENKYVPVQRGQPAVQQMFDGGQAALEEAEWFNPDIDVESTDGSNSGVFGGGSPDPGTGNQGAVDYDNTVFGIDTSDGSLQIVET